MGARIDFGDALGDEPVERPGEQPTADEDGRLWDPENEPDHESEHDDEPEEQIARGDSAQFRKERDEAEAVGARSGASPSAARKGRPMIARKTQVTTSMIAAARTSEPAIEARCVAAALISPPK